MFRTDTRYECEENGRAQAPLSSLSDGVQFEGHRRIYSQVLKQKMGRQAGIGPDVLLETECQGPVAARDVHVGQKVLTLENGFCRVLWAGRERNTSLQPTKTEFVQVNPGILGKATHGDAVQFAPGQNLLLRDPLNELFFGAPDVLAQTQFLTHLKGVDRVENEQSVDWVHILFDRVEMIQIEGLWVESMAPEFQAHRLGQSNIYDEIEDAIPSLKFEPGFAAYIHNLPVLNEKEVKMLTQNRV